MRVDLEEHKEWISRLQRLRVVHIKSLVELEGYLGDERIIEIERLNDEYVAVKLQGKVN